MIMAIKTFITTITFTFLFGFAIAQDRTNFTIIFPQSLKTDKVQIMVDNGIVQNSIQLKFAKNRATLVIDLKDKYSTLTILYPSLENKMYGVRLLISRKKGSIIFKSLDDTIENKLQKYLINNAIIITKSKHYINLKQFAKLEVEQNEYDRKQYQLNDTDSNLSNYNESSIILAIKELSYIKANGHEYFYFWYFRQNIVRYLLKTHQLDLYEVFNTAFPDKFKNSFEGKNLKALIEGNILIKRGYPSPLFDVKDHIGNTVSIKDKKGKYILLSFWATWCRPCLAEIPILKEIRNNFPNDKLEIVSVSFDEDSTSLIKGINKWDMNWTHIYGNDNIRNLFGDKPIPSLYLIDPEGIIQFSNWEDSMDRLKAILSANIKAN